MISQPVNDQDDFGTLLHGCLELIESGEESIESLLPRYPEIKDLLRPPLEAALWLYKRSWLFDPNPAFVVASRCRLIGNFRSETSALFPSKSTQPISLSTVRQSKHFGSFLVYLGAVVILLFIGFKSIGFWIESSLPGDPLYRLKLVNEDVRLTISLSDEKDAQMSIHFVERRIVEVERMILSGHDRFLPLAILEFEFELNQAKQKIQVLAKNNPQESLEYSTQLEKTVQLQANKLEALRGFYPEESQQLINRVILTSSN